MARLILATTATANPMGAQAYQVAIRDRAEAALKGGTQVWEVQSIVARSLRSGLSGNRRLPMGWLSRSSPKARRALGRIVYPADSVVHRMDLILPPPPGPDVVTLHDVVAWKYADESAPVKAAAQELRRADAVICVSLFTASQASELLGLRETTVIPNGVSADYFSARPLDKETADSLSLRRPYLLYAGGSAERKNLPALAEAWSSIALRRPEWQLALAGPTSAKREALFSTSPRVTHLGRLPDKLMPSLVAGAGAVVVPSLYEGFGLPALEAMATGTPLVAANTSSLPEVVGNTATLVPPTPQGLADGIEYVTGGDPHVKRLAEEARSRAFEFTWERSASRHAQVWKAVG